MGLRRSQRKGKGNAVNQLTLTIRVPGDAEAHDVIDTLNMALLVLAEDGKVDDTDDKGWAWTEPHQDEMQFMIRSLDEPELYWSNEHGWTEPAEADVFSARETEIFHLPLSAAWTPIDWVR